MERGPHGVGWSGGVWTPPKQRVSVRVVIECEHDRHAGHQGKTGAFNDDGLADVFSVELDDGTTAYVPAWCVRVIWP